MGTKAAATARSVPCAKAMVGQQFARLMAESGNSRWLAANSEQTPIELAANKRMPGRMMGLAWCETPEPFRACMWEPCDRNRPCHQIIANYLESFTRIHGTLFSILMNQLRPNSLITSP